MLEKPQNTSEKRKKFYIFRFPDDLKIKTKIICAKRSINMATFVREGIEKNIKFYEWMLKN
jgi:predicted DNA-binding protein